MPSTAALRIEIERALERRFLAALTPAPRNVRDAAKTGIEEVDSLLDGGIPVGAISEVTGPESSGRTSLAMAFLAGRTIEGQVCAWVDVEDSFDPESAGANGVALEQLLWVRCQDRNRQSNAKPWARIDQALRATDLLLQAGGFAAIVLDMGDTAPEYGSRIPLATWFRFRQAADRTRCSLLVLGKSAYAQSSAAVVLECAPLRADAAGETVLRGFTFGVRCSRQRFTPLTPSHRKPPGSTWSANVAWDARRSA